MFDPPEVILGILADVPGNKVVGKKRFQKLAHLLQAGGANFELDFELWHYGAFSKELANAANELAFYEAIREIEVSVGPHGIYQSEFTLAGQDFGIKRLPPSCRQLLGVLNAYTTTELEVASTVLYFEGEGLPRARAWAETQAMKPNKVIEPIVRKAREIIGTIDNAKGSKN